MHEQTINTYTFLPWLRQGLASEIPNQDDGSAVGERAEVAVRFKINGQEVEKEVQLIGPGDIIGINPWAVVKTEPRNWITDFEANYLAYIEFYEEDFPWRYTPASAVGNLDQSRLRPWIFLLVLAEDEFEVKKAGGLLPTVEIADPSAVFPKKDQTWAWAHVHVSKDINEGQTTTATPAEAQATVDRLESTLRINADNASSRLLSPRKLQPNTAYHALLIPAFEAGRLAGLGMPTSGVDALEASWGNGQTEYPVYYRWYFRSGERGDFEFLVELLEPRPVDERVGIRDMDMQEPGYEVSGMSGELAVMGLEGALKSPTSVPRPKDWEPEELPDFLKELEAAVNLQTDLQEEENEDNPHPDPLISPPLYGRWHAKVDKLDVRGQGWVDQLNKDPRNRTAAGFGTNVIQQNQEKFMQQAWSQLGDVLRANQKARQLQLALTASFRIYEKNLKPLSDSQLMVMTLPLHTRILGNPTTIAHEVNKSRLPAATMDQALRKIIRPRGVIMKKANPEKPAIISEVIPRLNEGSLTAAPPSPPADERLELGNLSAPLTPDWIPDWLRMLAAQKNSRWVLIGLIIIAVILIPLTGAIAFLLPVLVVLATTLAVTEWLRPRIETTETFNSNNWTPEQADQIPSRANFVLTEYGQPLSSSEESAGSDSAQAANFRLALKEVNTLFQTNPPPPPVRQPLDLGNAGLKIRQATNPVFAVTRRAEFQLRIPDSVKDLYLRPRKTIVPVMAHPVFSDPMYRPLRDISSELLIPNLNLIPNNTVSLMLVNSDFIESYMVGLNHEMGRELLWREYPTDQRGSYFRQFWDTGEKINRDENKTAAQIEEEQQDITPLHTWSKTDELGDHDNRPPIPGAQPGEERLVLVVRGDLLKKYPTAVIFAQKAMWNNVGEDSFIRELDDSNPAQNLQEPVFKAEIEPDIKFLGFNLTESMVKGNPDPRENDPGWYFVIQERPGEPRFGLDDAGADTPEVAGEWNQLAWEHLGNFDSLGFIDLDPDIEIDANITQEPDNQIQWGRNAADMAYILYQVPVMVAFHAADMLKK